MIKQIENGMINKKLISISYKDAKDQITTRTVEPYEIKNGKLFAHCRTRNSIRGFNLDRITSVTETNMDFEPRYPITIEGVQLHGGQVKNDTKRSGK